MLTRETMLIPTFHKFIQEELTVVDVPRTPQAVCSIMQHQLSGILNNIACANFRSNLYMEAIQVVGNHVQTGCEECFM